MDLKNYQEDVVLGMIDILLEDEPDFQRDQQFKYDIAAYTLNRIPPKYFMSERGFTRFADLYLTDEDNPDGFANLVELSVIINQAIDTVKLRRSSKVNEPPATEEPTEPAAEYIHNFPHIIGKALDVKTRVPVCGATVSLFIDGNLVNSAGPGWPNPCRTTELGKGYFSFWPKHILHRNTNLAHSFGIKIEAETYSTCEIQLDVSTAGEFERRETVRSESIVSLDACLLEPTH